MAFKTSQIQAEETAIRKKAKKSKVQIKESEQKEILEAEKVYRQGVTSVKDLIAPASFRVEPRLVEINGQYLATIFVINYPRYINVGWFSPVINYSSPLDVSMFFYQVKTEIILKQLRKKVGALEAQLMADAEKGAPRDPLRETALRDIERLRDDLTQGTEKFFQFSLYVTIYAKTREELESLVERLESVFGSKLVYTKRALYQAEQGFNSCLPLNNDELQISFNMNSSPIATSFPFISSELTSNDGILYGINRHNNSLIIFDRFSLQNPNSVVFATSGAGKSYAIKLEILRSLMMGTDVIIIDPENEYKYLCDAVGGAYINLSLNSESKLNPFDLPRPVGNDSRPADIIRSAVITLKGLVRLMLGELSHKEDSLVDRALIETYAKKDITPDSNLAAIEPPLMKDFEEVLAGMEGGDDLVIRLKKYTEGTFAGLFNSPSNIDVKNQLICFSVRDLEDELKPIAIYTIVNYIWNTVRSEIRKRILVIDEAWWLMQREDSAKFIFALVKRCRKYYLGVTTITQDVNDFLRSPYGQAIVTNSALQILLKQSPAGIDVIQKTFRLTDGEKYLLLEGNVGEGIFFAGNKHVAILIRASYTEDQIITSDPRQLLEIEASKKEFDAEMASDNSADL
ncbi:MAG: Type IV secretory pathway VirB4 component-like protein [Parcubacteria group bacterium GW2011_GWA2_43_17]|nr:MAG: Type IV secretory pathway VirB4 component-like protein [Parcubacteria group bacterium GW2011_GWA2_43_17]KKT93975.1 MAG: Type IV secretory pathway VirB4 component-like protein [Parcubacteria group bacterium GW2011_GWF2_45_11]HBV02152.1 conjugal transfer protein TraC [Candidatus Komeilibacteria bacterium]HCC73759.1 conjugal transfer protein TraC [Candidatus Komeilibacteria bacterium]